MYISGDLMAEGRTVAAKYRDMAQAVEADSRLSPEGKAAKLQEIETARRAAVGELQEDARRQLEETRAAGAATLKAKRGARGCTPGAFRAGTSRPALQAELSVSTPAEIARRYETAGTAWSGNKSPASGLWNCAAAQQSARRRRRNSRRCSRCRRQSRPRCAAWKWILNAWNASTWHS